LRQTFPKYRQLHCLPKTYVQWAPRAQGLTMAQSSDNNNSKKDCGNGYE